MSCSLFFYGFFPAGNAVMVSINCFIPGRI